MRRFFAIALFTSLIVLSGCDFDDFDMGAQVKEDFHHSYALKSGGRLEMENYNGSIEINGWDKETIEISGTKRARSKELLDRIKIEIDSTPDAVRIRTNRPEHDRLFSNAGVSYIVSVPKKLVLERIASTNGSIRLRGIEGKGRLKTTNGSVRAAEFKGDLEANTTNGAIDLGDVQGGATAQTTNGSIKAHGVRGSFEGRTTNGSVDVQITEASGKPVRVGTTNGRVTLQVDALKGSDIFASTRNGSITAKLPASLSARLHAQTSNASISSDFDVTAQGRISKHNLDGTVGAGGPVVDLTTTNGTIRINKM